MKRRGSAMIEASAAFLLFAGLVSAGFHVVRNMTTIHEMESAVRAGARAGARHPSPYPEDPRFRAAVIAAVMKESPRVKPGDVIVETDWEDGVLRQVRVRLKGYRNVANYPWTGPDRVLHRD